MEYVRAGQLAHTEWTELETIEGRLRQNLHIEKLRREKYGIPTDEDDPLDEKLQEWEELRNAANDAEQNAQAELNTALQLVMHLPHELWENAGRLRSSRSLFLGFLIGTAAMLYVSAFTGSPRLAILTPLAFSLAGFAAGGLWRWLQRAE